MTEAQTLNNTVIKNGYCIGCGSCTYIKNSPFRIKLDEFGCYVAYVENENQLNKSNSEVLTICPFSGLSKNEDELGQIFFPFNINRDSKIGKYLKCYVGYVIDDEYRSKGSSGGFGKWLGKTLLKEHEIDYFIQLSPNYSNDPQKPLFDYKIFNNEDDIINGSKSAYYPTTLADILKQIEKQNGNYAITGTPCFIKTLRLLMTKYPVLKERIKYTIGIVCGGMKSANHAKMISWELGIHPNILTRIDFRGKEYGITAATTKLYTVWSKNNEKVIKDSLEIYGTDYGMGLFKPKACDFCDDVTSELADISIGDVWLPEYRFDKKGYSLIIIRDNRLLELFTRYSNQNEISINTLDYNLAIKSQEGGFRHRREGLSYRLQLETKKGNWVPSKRVSPGEFSIPRKSQKIYELRSKLSEISHPAFLEALSKNDLQIFRNHTNKLIEKYKKTYRGNFVERYIKRIKNRLKLFLK